MLPLNRLHQPRLGVGQGVKYWMLQRATSIVVMSYVVFLSIVLISNPSLSYADWQALFGQTGVKIFSTLFMLSLCWHGWVGLWGVITDYVKPPHWRLYALSLLLILNITYFIWGFAIIWHL